MRTPQRGFQHPKPAAAPTQPQSNPNGLICWRQGAPFPFQFPQPSCTPLRGKMLKSAQPALRGAIAAARCRHNACVVLVIVLAACQRRWQPTLVPCCRYCCCRLARFQRKALSGRPGAPAAVLAGRSLLPCRRFETFPAAPAVARARRCAVSSWPSQHPRCASRGRSSAAAAASPRRRHPRGCPPEPASPGTSAAPSHPPRSH